jgi:uncharacterized membrane protein HdeD (DUF308 family)
MPDALGHYPVPNPRYKERNTVSQSFPPSAVGAHHDEHASMRQLWLLLFVLGLASVILGILAISFAFVTTLATVAVLGILLLIAGIAEVIHAVMVRNLKGFALHLLGAALYLIVGLFMLEDPRRAAEVLTLLLAAAFLVGGVLRIIFSIAVRFPSWPWVALNGVIDLILGILIWSGWPESSIFIGLLVGIDLLFHGWSWVILALTVRTYSPAPSA